jgi:amino-acid N-acetyltransferase
MIRKAVLNDSDFIYNAVKNFADEGKMLYRSLNEIYENIRDYFVVEKNGQLIGCGALNICWKDLAEIKSLAIVLEWQGKGVGRLIVEKCLAEAKELGVKQVFVFTYQPDFFKKLGFKDEDKNNLPKKIWSDCIKCTKFSECDENCLSILLS